MASFPGDPRFYASGGPQEAAALAAFVGGALLPPADASAIPRLVGIAPLGASAPDRVSFLDNRKYAAELAATASGVVILSAALADRRPTWCAAIVAEEPYVAWARIALAFHPRPALRPGIDARASVSADASVDPLAEIAAFASVGAGASIGAGTRIGEGAVVGAGVAVGRDCRIEPGVTLSHAIVGDRVTLHPGARIGQEGFGFAVGREGFLTVPQLGLVRIGDDVEIGANATVDRGSASDTVIGAGSRLDNLVQIGHNVRLGRCCVVVAQAGISGSTTLDDFVTVAAQAGLTGHLRIGARARIGAQAGVMGDVESGADVVGSPAIGVREFFRGVVTLRKLARRSQAPDRGPDGDVAGGRGAEG